MGLSPDEYREKRIHYHKKNHYISFFIHFFFHCTLSFTKQVLSSMLKDFNQSLNKAALQNYSIKKNGRRYFGSCIYDFSEMDQ